MKLYVNGGSHAAAAESVVLHHCAQDDHRWLYLGTAPHPSNAPVAWSRVLANTIKAVLHLDAESGLTNQQICQNTHHWIKLNQPWISETLVLIQWETQSHSLIQEHDNIWQFHKQLQNFNIKHVFFNSDCSFCDIPKKDRKDWGISYISPYDPEMTYSQWLKNNGFNTVASDSGYFGASAHAAWARFMLQYVVANKLMN
jgi:hypothetical protein